MDRKVIIVGNSFSGKTSLLKRFTENSFDEKYNSTSNAGFKIRNLGRFKLLIWDIPHKLNRGYCRNSRGAIIVFDLSDRKSFEDISYWISEVKKYSKEASILLVGTKSDLESKISDEEIKRFEIPFFKVSSKNNVGIGLVFSQLIEYIKIGDSLIKAKFSVLN